ncbi:hypothetical protein CBR_g39008 [Chara braunii]|uniref:Acyl carrier protein n=1 Tax=Chara braunii TaxID=69332 RepID=A0A388K0Z3_CHABU|nr:hypothetical protein CBR_g39008 [Chara braunii]|eukprot:GBG63697.1 hypothetical protein CBR_g39008 [Chara braunii]
MAAAAAASLRQVVTAHCIASTSSAAAIRSTRVQACARGFSLRLCAPRVSASRSLSFAARRSVWKPSTRRTTVRCSADASGAAAAELDPAVIEKVIDIIVEKAGVERGQIKPHTGLEELVDSLDQVEIMMSLEDEYHIELDEQNAAKLSTVMDVAKYIAEEMKKPKSK